MVGRKSEANNGEANNTILIMTKRDLLVSILDKIKFHLSRIQEGSKTWFKKSNTQTKKPTTEHKPISTQLGE